MLLLILQRYEFSSKSQHSLLNAGVNLVVADTTKVRIFKQITTLLENSLKLSELLLILQRYEFSSKSQQSDLSSSDSPVVADTTKVRIFKQITTPLRMERGVNRLLLILQRYEFSSKSQLIVTLITLM